jgi:Domain of unknown function (DUF4375)
MRAGRVSRQFGRIGPPASLSSYVGPARRASEPIMEAGTPTYDIDAILAKVEAKDVVTALLDALNARRNACKSAKLIGREKDIYWLDIVHSSIFCDGITGTLLNYGLLPLVFSAEAMERIGAVERARILKQAVESFGDQERVGELTKKFRPHMVTPEQEKLFEELDTRYYHVWENFSELGAAYIKQHVEEFRGYQTQRQLAQPTAPPNGGPAMHPDNSGVAEGRHR